MSEQRKVITITQEEPHTWWTVRCGERYQDQLDASETLWTIACLLLGKGAGYLRTEEEHKAFRKIFGIKEPLEEWQKQLGPAETRS